MARFHGKSPVPKLGAMAGLADPATPKLPAVPAMPAVVKAAFAYVLPVFAVAFAAGAARHAGRPQTGALAAVALELPLVLALSWAVAGRVLRRWPQAPRAAIGALAFALLMLLELATALAFGQTPAAFLAALPPRPARLASWPAGRLWPDAAGPSAQGLSPLDQPREEAGAHRRGLVVEVIGRDGAAPPPARCRGTDRPPAAPPACS
jgi:hypothetical protein